MGTASGPVPPARRRSDMAAFGEEWQKRHRRRWWQKVIDVPLDLLALLLEWSGEDSWVHRTIGKHLDKPPERILPLGEEEEDGNSSRS